ncbi:MAG: hypothetical protein K8R36_19460, partial [Planctomycetales bacterium]|nr:hypothetical protein [Planctomycetales bacterium]
GHGSPSENGARAAAASPVSDKLDAGRQLLLEAISDTANPLGIFPDAKVVEITFDRTSGFKATGVTSSRSSHGPSTTTPSSIRTASTFHRTRRFRFKRTTSHLPAG